jgi:cold shock CspA family protein
VSQRTGIVGSWFNGEGGYGFIHPDDGGAAVFVHPHEHSSVRQSEVPEEGCPGDLRSSQEEDGWPVGEGRLHNGLTKLNS